MQGNDIAYPSFADGLRGIQLVEAAVESARTQRTIRIAS